ncbi:MAG TPA: DoxX family membrane protein, partial [Ramlibacter sp.]|nr:DoxX family membrane protein [Ramlibacter sp.]
MIKNTAPYAALLLRVSLGMAFLAHGSVKVFVFGPTAAAAWFASIGLPAVVAYTTIVLEV